MIRFRASKSGRKQVKYGKSTFGKKKRPNPTEQFAQSPRKEFRTSKTYIKRLTDFFLGRTVPRLRRCGTPANAYLASNAYRMNILARAITLSFSDPHSQFARLAKKSCTFPDIFIYFPLCASDLPEEMKKLRKLLDEA